MIRLATIARYAELPERCGCGALVVEQEEAGLLRRRSPRCGAGESLSLAALEAALSTRAERLLQGRGSARI